jgi:hypothetical protein
LLGEALGEVAEQGVVVVEHIGLCSAFFLVVPIRVLVDHPLN